MDIPIIDQLNKNRKVYYDIIREIKGKIKSDLAIIYNKYKTNRPNLGSPINIGDRELNNVITMEIKNEVKAELTKFTSDVLHADHNDFIILLTSTIFESGIDIFKTNTRSQYDFKFIYKGGNVMREIIDTIMSNIYTLTSRDQGIINSSNLIFENFSKSDNDYSIYIIPNDDNFDDEKYYKIYNKMSLWALYMMKYTHLIINKNISIFYPFYGTSPNDQKKILTPYFNNVATILSSKGLTMTNMSHNDNNNNNSDVITYVADKSKNKTRVPLARDSNIYNTNLNNILGFNSNTDSKKQFIVSYSDGLCFYVYKKETCNEDTLKNINTEKNEIARFNLIRLKALFPAIVNNKPVKFYGEMIDVSIPYYHHIKSSDIKKYSTHDGDFYYNSYDFNILIEDLENITGINKIIDTWYKEKILKRVKRNIIFRFFKKLIKNTDFDNLSKEIDKFITKIDNDETVDITTTDQEIGPNSQTSSVDSNQFQFVNVEQLNRSPMSVNARRTSSNDFEIVNNGEVFFYNLTEYSNYESHKFKSKELSEISILMKYLRSMFNKIKSKNINIDVYQLTDK